MKAPLPDLHVQHQPAAALGQLLAHDAGGDQRDATRPWRSRRAGRRACVGRRDVGGLADDGAARPSRSTRRNSSRDRSVRKPGMDSSLSSVPPVWPRPRPDIIGTGTPHAATSGASTSDDLVAHAAGGVLVHLACPGCPTRSSAAAGAHHRVGQRGGLRGVHAAQVHGHQQRRHLVIGNLLPARIFSMTGRKSPPR